MIATVAAGLLVVGSITIVCAPYTAIVEELTARGEVYDGGGPAIDSASVELWRAAAGGEWHLLKIFPSGVACILAAGVDWKSGDGI